MCIKWTELPENAFQVRWLAASSLQLNKGHHLQRTRRQIHLVSLIALVREVPAKSQALATWTVSSYHPESTSGNQMHLALATHIHKIQWATASAFSWLNKEGDCHKQGYCSIGIGIKGLGQILFVCQLLFRRKKRRKANQWVSWKESSADVGRLL